MVCVQATKESLLSVEDLATYLSVPQSWIYDHVGALPTIRVGRRLRWRLSDIDAYLEANKEEPLRLILGKGRA